MKALNLACVLILVFHSSHLIEAASLISNENVINIDQTEIDNQVVKEDESDKNIKILVKKRTITKFHSEGHEDILINRIGQVTKSNSGISVQNLAFTVLIISMLALTKLISDSHNK